jgi:hypothetical protein
VVVEMAMKMIPHEKSVKILKEYGLVLHLNESIVVPKKEVKK